MIDTFFTAVRGMRVWCEFKSHYCGTSDYEVGVKDKSCRVRVGDDGKATAFAASEIGLSEAEVIAVVYQRACAEHANYLRWHEMNKASMGLGEPEPMAAKFTALNPNKT